MDALWVVVPLLALARLLAAPIGDVDIFWQLRLGDLMLDSHWPVTREPFAATHLGEALVPLSALAQIVLAGVRRLGGWPAVQIVDALAWTGGFLAVGLAARARGAMPLRLALALVLCQLMAMPFAGVRPQSFAVLGLGALILLLGRELPLRRTLLAGGAVLVLWQNLHPSVSLAAAYLGARAAAGWLRHRTGRRTAPPWAETLLLPLAGLAMVATPAGFAVFDMATLNARMSTAMGATEWLSVLDPQNRPFLPILLILNGGVLALLGVVRRELDLEALAGALVFLLMALIAGRFVLFWALALVPVLAGGRHDSGPIDRLALLLFAAGAGVIALTAAARPGPRFAPDLPIAAVDRLAARGLAGTVYASYPFGGVIADRGFPRLRVAFDGRYYRYGMAEWDLCRAAMAGQVPVSALVARYRPVAWVLSPGMDRPLIEALRAQPQAWREVPGDPAAVLFVPAGAGSGRAYTPAFTSQSWNSRTGRLSSARGRQTNQ